MFANPLLSRRREEALLNRLGARSSRVCLILPTDTHAPAGNNIAEVIFRGLLTGDFPRGSVGVAKPKPRVPSFRSPVASPSSSRASATARAADVCRKSIQLAGFHGAKPRAIVPGIGIFTTPPPPPPPPLLESHRLLLPQSAYPAFFNRFPPSRDLLLRRLRLLLRR